MRLALAQLNPHVGDVRGNAAAIRAAYDDAVGQGAALVATGELALTGYPPEDLVIKPAFVAAVADALEELARSTGESPLVVGFVEQLADTGGDPGVPVLSESTAARNLANSAAVLRNGRVEQVYRKHRIPNYGVFDEARYFRAGSDVIGFEVGGMRAAVTVCEDLWGSGGPVQDSASGGAEVVLNLNASPYQADKRGDRERWAAEHARTGGVYLAYVNLIGGQDEVVFDGDSFVMAPTGKVVARAARFATDCLLVDLPSDEVAPPEQADPVAEGYHALVLGTRDYLRKNGFDRALVGLSGGLDSSLSAVIAADAIGPDAVTGVAMPSPYSSQGSLDDARALATNLGIRYLELPIEAGMRAFDEMLAEPFEDTEEGVAEENIQARIRGMLLMALSNKFGDVVLASGNKSELAVGYATLYGDMAGGFAVLKDVWKTLAYEMSRFRNRDAEVIPTSVIDKPPSAELRPDQEDTDSLPPYEDLDPILAAYVEDHRSADEIIADGHDEGVVREVLALVDRAEFKRRQAAPGVKITRRAFGRDRRLPITQKWPG
jgi:NAD+ synthase (glutamine-hydrolysing)